MSSSRRVLFVSELPLAASARSFLGRSSIEIETKSEVDVSELIGSHFDLVILDAARVDGQLGTALDQCADAAERLLVLSDTVPDDSLLDKAAAFLVEPFSQAELIGAIGDLLGTELRRAMRLGVNIAGSLTRPSDRKSPATILQLSENGCLFEVESPISVGEAVFLTFVLPSTGERLELTGAVVSGNELQLLYGMRFDTKKETERLAILVFVELGLAGGGSESPGVAQGQTER